MSQEKYIGMDFHQATISAAVMDAHGKLLMECLLETKASTIVDFIQRMARNSVPDLRGRNLSCLVRRSPETHVSRLVVCDPRKAALWKEGNQSDRIEARKLAELLRTNQLQALGGLATDFLFLVMNERGARSILNSKVKIRVMCLHLWGRSDATPRPNRDVYLRTLILT